MSNINASNKVNVKDLALAGQRVIKLTQNGEAIFLPVGLSSLAPNGGDSSVKFGYWTADGKFQEVDLSGDSPVDNGSPVTADAVMFDTGKETPSYGGNDDSNVGAGIEFYECANYIPEADAYTKYSFTLSGEADELANGTYVRTKYVENIGDDVEYVTGSIWQNDNGYFLIEEYEYGFWRYYLKNSSGNGIYGLDNPIRLTDFNSIYWWDYITGDEVTLNFSAWQTEEIPATEESWSGYLILQNTQDGTWSKTDQLFEGLEARGYMPKVGKIYSKDTTVACSSLLTVAEGSMVALYHFDNDQTDTTGNTTATLYEKRLSTSEAKFGSKSLYGDVHMGSDGSSIAYMEITGLPELDAFTIEWWQYDNNDYGDGSYFLTQVKTDDLPLSMFPAFVIQRSDQTYISTQFKHWAFVREEGSRDVSVFLNGKNIGSVDFKDKLGGRVIRFTGIGSDNVTQSKVSYIDELAIFDYPKYRKNFTPPDEPYVV